MRKPELFVLHWGKMCSYCRKDNLRKVIYRFRGIKISRDIAIRNLIIRRENVLQIKIPSIFTKMIMERA